MLIQSLLLHLDGSNDGTTFTDSSSNHHIRLLANGNASILETGPKRNLVLHLVTWNGGTGNNLTVAANTDFEFGSQWIPYTIEVLGLRPAVGRRQSFQNMMHM